ncbi:MAG: hypothetical protein V4539_03180 [Bacteroidota bacterium]
MKWKEKILRQLEDMAHQNGRLLLRVEQSWYFLPTGFCEEVRKLEQQINKLQQLVQ